jgi:chaperonin cofactor prefoldin
MTAENAALRAKLIEASETVRVRIEGLEHEVAAARRREDELRAALEKASAASQVAAN